MKIVVFVDITITLSDEQESLIYSGKVIKDEIYVITTLTLIKEQNVWGISGDNDQYVEQLVSRLIRFIYNLEVLDMAYLLVNRISPKISALVFYITLTHISLIFINFNRCVG
jgi:hypothetical protein